MIRDSEMLNKSPKVFWSIAGLKLRGIVEREIALQCRRRKTYCASGPCKLPVSL